MDTPWVTPITIVNPLPDVAVNVEKTPGIGLRLHTLEVIMDEHLAAWQIAEFILGGLDDNELKAVYRHFDDCGDCVSWLAGVVRVAAYE